MRDAFRAHFLALSNRIPRRDIILCFLFYFPVVIRSVFFIPALTELVQKVYTRAFFIPELV